MLIATIATATTLLHPLLDNHYHYHHCDDHFNYYYHHHFHHCHHVRRVQKAKVVCQTYDLQAKLEKKDNSKLEGSVPAEQSPGFQLLTFISIIVRTSPGQGPEIPVTGTCTPSDRKKTATACGRLVQI